MLQHFCLFDLLSYSDGGIRLDLQLAVLLVDHHDSVLGQLLLGGVVTGLHIVSFIGGNVRLRIGTNVSV